MKAIILNETQKDMLTEMAKDLFPDWKEICDWDYGDRIRVNVTENGCNIYFEWDAGNLEIPWLEFCIFYLQPKLKTYYSTITIKALEGKYIESLHRIFKLIYNGKRQRDSR